MARKSRQSSAANVPGPGVPATVSGPHPADFPLGSIESRAAARAMMRPDRLRAGDKGTLDDGCTYIVVPDSSRGGKLMQIVFPRSFTEVFCLESAAKSVRDSRA